jgi:hypothetical protein
MTLVIEFGTATASREAPDDWSIVTTIVLNQLYLPFHSSFPSELLVMYIYIYQEIASVAMKVLMALRITLLFQAT